MRDNREIIEMLKVLKEQALKSHNDTAVLGVKIASFNFVLDEAIKSLEQQPCEDWHGVPSDEMTLEQARQAVKDLRKMLPEYLEQNPYEDVVSRRAVLDTLDKMDKALDTDRTVESYKELLTECYKVLPPVTPKEKTGHWIPVEYPTGVEAFGIKEMTAVALRCSVCEKEVDISDGDFKLCPYCGAKMIEPQESEDTDGNS